MPPTVVTGHKKKSETMVLVNATSKNAIQKSPHYHKTLCRLFYDSKNFFPKIFIFIRKGGFHTSYVVFLSINIKIMTTPANADFVYEPVILNLQPCKTEKQRNSGALNLSVSTNPALFAEVGERGVIIKNHKL